MIKILFVCHGNICRSVAAEMVLRQMIDEARPGSLPEISVESAAATREEIGNDIYPPMKRALQARGYVCHHHAAWQTTRADYDRFDYIIGMDSENLYDMRRIYGGDASGKISLLRAWAGQPGREIDDPWYTRNFEGVLSQIEEGCRGLLSALAQRAFSENVDKHGKMQ